MDRIRVKNTQKAQGLLEFALVLPILLLVILGIFAMGHMFYAYTSIVSASREAARYGAVVGVGQGGIERYKDCAGIRAAAERIGTYVGVTATEATGFDGEDPGIFIGYDEGPTTTPYDDCPVGGIGPSQVELGDRILVRVSIDYEPIVPLLDLPSFPLSATTARTIIKDVAVGTAPPAESVCETASINFDLLYNFVPESYPYLINVGQVMFPSVLISASDGSEPGGDVFIYDAAEYLKPSNQRVPICEFDAPNNNYLIDEGTIEDCELVYPEATEIETVEGEEEGYHVVIDYVPDSNSSICFGVNADFEVKVIPADTITELVLNPVSYTPRANVEATVTVRTDTPGGGVPIGDVIVRATGGGSRNPECIIRSPATTGVDTFTGSCSLGRNWEEGKTYTITAYFEGNENYNPSSSVGLPLVVPAMPDEEFCADNTPVVVSVNLSSADTFAVSLRNRNYPLTLTQVMITWPDPGTTVGVPYLQSINFGGEIWNSNGAAIGPLSYTVSGLNELFLSNARQELQARYTPGLVTGNYTATLTFTGDDANSYSHTCTVSASGGK